jgi:hypothetical protein
VVSRIKRDRRCSGLCEVLQPVASRCDSRLRCYRQRDRDARIQELFKRAVARNGPPVLLPATRFLEMIHSGNIRGESSPVTQASACVSRVTTPLLWRCSRRSFCRMLDQPFPTTIASAPNGGLAFAGKSGRNTAKACEANAIEATMITAAHLMVGALSDSRSVTSEIFS